jgi:hypothetical protein
MFIESSEKNAGIDLSATGEKFFTRNFALYLALSYSTSNAGISINDSLNYNIADCRYALKYFGIPIGGKFVSDKLTFAKKFRVLSTFYLNPQMNLGSKSELSSTTRLQSFNEISEFNLSLAISLGLEYEIDRVTFLYTGINYSNGLVNIVNTSDISTYSATPNGGVIKNGSLSFVLGLLYTINQ